MKQSPNDKTQLSHQPIDSDMIETLFAALGTIIVLAPFMFFCLIVLHVSLPVYRLYRFYGNAA
ncbi:MAG: hypothetical protein LBJ00_09485 [Planctomycetaceae bacterium]|jgi:hypothetical protein|nr:hypothetical protein [Planctomycetaceae bacterium]